MTTPVSRAGRIWRSAVSAGVVMLGLSGCIKYDVDMKVKADTTLDGTMIVAMTEQALAALEDFEFDSDSPTTKPKPDFEAQAKEDAKKLQAKLPKGSTAKLYKKGGFIGQEISFKGVPAESVLEIAVDEEDSDDDSDSSLKVTKSGDKLILEGFLDFGQTDEGGFDPGAFGAKPEMRLKFTFPGKVTKASAGGKISGKSVVWTPKFGENLTFTATANAK
jgi:hypothetical protein